MGLAWGAPRPERKRKLRLLAQVSCAYSARAAPGGKGAAIETREIANWPGALIPAVKHACHTDMQQDRPFIQHTHMGGVRNRTAV